jgi:hypothetical protein
MSRHWRFCGSAFLVFAGLSTLPAFSNPLEDLLNPAPKETAAPAAAPAPPAKEACTLQPGRSAAPGQHWFYRLDGHRKCWFQAPEEHASARKQSYRHAARQPVADPEENEAAPRKKSVADARAQLLSAAAPDASEPAPPAPRVVVDAAALPASATATPAPAAPVIAEPTIEQLKSHVSRRPVDVETLLAADVPLSRDTAVSSVPPAHPPASANPEAGKDQWGSMASQAGVMLIALGLVSVLAGLLLARRFRDPLAVQVSRADDLDEGWRATDEMNPA